MRKLKQIDKLPLTCSDCKYHKCTATIGNNSCEDCTGICSILRRHRTCNRHVHGCQHYKPINWSEIVEIHL